ncbi:hypothetical protein MsAc7_09570 [Methanolapillus millepedarum]|uniref:Uncharacterized protein n=2 Tax=Methanolapillus millepedarum TaxID=3028296 RepID=A0AA96V2P4_9EURY|nr:hypothetical protein MsAc7_09570 [Methanosarcinaceae archaeon Ac7]
MFFVKNPNEIKKYYARQPNFPEILWYVTQALKEKYGSRLLRKMKIEVECDWHFLEIQIPITGSDIPLHREFFGLCEEARNIYGSVADNLFLITRYEDY